MEFSLETPERGGKDMATIRGIQGNGKASFGQATLDQIPGAGQVVTGVTMKVSGELPRI